MLVLARQVNERIILPTVAATIEVVAVKPNGARLGIEAPPDVPILREEVMRRGGMAPASLRERGSLDTESALPRIRHLLRNRLQTIALALNLLRQQVQAQPLPDLAAMLLRMEDEVRTLDGQLRALLAGKLEEGEEAVCLGVSVDGVAI